MSWQDDLRKDCEMKTIVNYDMIHAIERKITQD